VEAKKALEWAKNNITHCYLCGEEGIITIGCFVPDDPTKWISGKPPPGKARTFWYGLCERCSKLSDIEGLVEKKMESEMN